MDTLVKNEQQFAAHLLKTLIAHQKPNGEFGKHRRSNVVQAVRAFHAEERLIEKPQAFTTMIAIEQLSRLGGNKHHKEIEAALAWLHDQTSSGVFMSSAPITEPTDTFVSNQPVTEKTKSVRVFRHTAEALCSFARFEDLTYATISILNNLLLAQNPDGGWSNTELMPESKLLSTVFCAEAISYLNTNKLRVLFHQSERENKALELNQALERAVNWIVHKNREGLGFWYLPDVSEDNKYFYTGIVLGRITHLLIRYCPSLAQQAIDRLQRARQSGVWWKAGSPDLDGTARVAAALVKSSKQGLQVDHQVIAEAKERLMALCSEEDARIDPATIGYLLEVYCPDVSNSKRNTDCEYQVALSFAGEDRCYAAELAAALTDRGITVFYDSYEQATLWGKDLYQHLQTIYKEKSKFCVIFVSEAYSKKLWTKHELRQAQARAFLDSKEYILPIKLDCTEIPGLNETTGYVDLKENSIVEIAELIVKKLAE
ncbi:MAG TPA: TIR domain-containing protein [Pyrinomonadaceae bacterium]|nr:TIR domain-containing protein [Pyrinomonadaceae bacterium]